MDFINEFNKWVATNGITGNVIDVSLFKKFLKSLQKQHNKQCNQITKTIKEAEKTIIAIEKKL